MSAGDHRYAWKKERFDHWPYAADHARRHLDPQQIEHHAVRILARGMRAQRLVAFVGAGLSVAYGRITWRDWIDSLYEGACSLKDEGGEQFRAVQSNLLWSSLDDFRKMGDAPVQAQILADCTPGLGFRFESVGQLGSHQGYVAAIRRALDRAKRPALGPRHAGDSVTVGLKGAVRYLLTATEGPDPDQNTHLVDAIDHSLTEQPTDRSSPLRQLVVDWRIRRFITTNYDAEIERALSLFGYKAFAQSAGDSVAPGPQGPGSGHSTENHGSFSVPGTGASPRFHSFNFEIGTTASATAFAVDGGRRHAEVMHLHGRANDANSWPIITEADYQALYLAEHPNRDLVTNAAQANFASNPMLFVGSDVSEADVLRPIRQFMSGPGHRSDRLAVALFPGTSVALERAARTAKLLLQYRVHAVFAVQAVTAHSSENISETKNHPEWLSDAKEAVDAFGNLANAVRERKDVDQLRSLFIKAWEKLGLGKDRIVVAIEGVDAKKLQLPDGEPLLLDLSCMPYLQTALEPTGTISWGPEEADWYRYLTGQWLAHVISTFVCAKLIYLREQAQRNNDKETYQPRTFSKWILPYTVVIGKRLIQMDSRHRVCLDPFTVQGRFAEPAVAFDEDIKDLVKAINDWTKLRNEWLDKHPPDSTMSCVSSVSAEHTQLSYRRLIVITGARGAGKGGQFDRLAFSPRRDATNQPLVDLINALCPDFPDTNVLVLHFNLGFADDVTAAVRHLCDAVDQFVGDAEDCTQHADQDLYKPTNDLLEALDRSLVKLGRAKSHRLVLILGNAGVLFDQDGIAKNSLVHRVVRTLQAKPFANVPLDLLMYVGESQVPAFLRSGLVLSDAKRDDTYLGIDHRWHRRMRQLGVRTELSFGRGVLVHGLRKNRVEHLTQAYFPNLYGLLVQGDGLDDLFRALYRETGGSRFAQTLVLACLDGWCVNRESARAALSQLISRLHGLVSHSAAEVIIEVVLDTWAERFLTATARLPPASLPDLAKLDSMVSSSAQQAFRTAWSYVTKQLSSDDRSGKRLRAFWRLSTQLLWHASAFTHPVELHVFGKCERIQRALADFVTTLEPSSEAPPQMALAVCAELLCHWCLLFRIAGCSLPARLQAEVDQVGEFRYRYAVHRNVQRHYLKLMGGRGVESTFWDQFSTTLYASQPDEMPALRPDAHHTLRSVVKKLTRYPTAEEQPTVCPLPGEGAGPDDPVLSATESWREMVRDAEDIRAAYFLARSTYSVGVITRLKRTEDAIEDRTIPQQHASDRLGHLEEHRRMLRWIIHAAEHWQDEHSGVIKRWWLEPAASRGIAPQDQGAAPMGVFYPGELVWLYNECGVVSIVQGKMQDAEQMISQAESIVRRLETDDTGPLYTRIRLHVGIIHIERGRPHLARRVLDPIAQRPHFDDELPGVIARFYLGLLAHLGGNYQKAEDQYAKVLVDLQKRRQSRAAAFVLMHQADLLLRKSNRTQPADALAKAEEAISLAQQGGHEDLRHIAKLSLIRLRIQIGDFSGAPLFSMLDSIQRYAIEMDMPRIACEAHELRARLLYAQGEYVLSAAEVTRSLEISALYDLKLFKARSLLTLAKIYRRRGHLVGAAALVRSGKEIATSADYFTCVRGFTQLETVLQRSHTATPFGRTTIS